MKWLVALLLIFALAGETFPDGALAAGGCSDFDAFTGNCDVPESSGSIKGDAVELEANTGGSAGGGGDTSTDSDGDGGSGPPVVELEPIISTDGTDVSLRALTGSAGDGGSITCGAVVVCDPLPTVVALADIAAFRPVAPRQGMEPDGWAIAGLPANFSVVAPASVQAGQLLGFDARVRFSPVRYRWASSDGAQVTSRGPGASWAALGLPEFSETPTSMVFSTTGRFTVSSTVLYTAEYSFAGQPWRSIAGTLAVSANEITVIVDEATTVLVARSCLQDPAGPGC